MTTFNRRTLLTTGAKGLGALGLGAVGLSGCGDDDSSSASGGSDSLGALTVQLNWIKDISFGGDYYMVEKKLATAIGFSGVDLIVGGPSISAEPVVASGKARFGYSSPELLAAALDSGAKLKTIGVGYQRNPFTIISLAESPINEPGGLKGKTIAVDDINKIPMSAFLQANGVDEGDVTIVPANYDPSLLSSKQVDAYLAYAANEPLSLQVEGIETVQMDFDDHGLPGAGQTYITTEEMISKEPETVTAALKAFVQGWNGYLADLPGGITIAVKNFDADAVADPAFVELGAQAYSDNYLTDDTKANGVLTMTEERQEAVIGGLKVGGIATTAKDLFDMTLLDQLYADEPALKTVG
jgi:ABC-type nitrate/sulfonate/bicarbonate transport system substrate-binding protein